MNNERSHGSIHAFVLELLSNYESFQIAVDRNLGNHYSRVEMLARGIDKAWENVPASVRRYYIEEFKFRGLRNLEVLFEKIGNNEPPL